MDSIVVMRASCPVFIVAIYARVTFIAAISPWTVLSIVFNPSRRVSYSLSLAGLYVPPLKILVICAACSACLV